MLVFLLLLFQSWHTRDAQEGVVGISVPHQQLLVRRDHLQGEKQREVKEVAVASRRQGSLHTQP